MSVRFRGVALSLLLSLAVFGSATGLFAGSATGTASATVVGPAKVEEALEAGELRIRLPGLAVSRAPTAAANSSEQVKVALEQDLKRQCDDANPCCNPPSMGQLEGDLASSVFASPVQLEKGISCRLTVMYN